MIRKVYMIVTADRFELPVLASENVEDLAAFLGYTRGTVFSSISKGCLVACKYRIVKVSLDPGDSTED